MTTITPADAARAVRDAPRPDWGWPGLTIEIGWRIRMSGGGMWAATISENRMTKSGRPGKPQCLFTLVKEDLPALMHEVADLLDPNGPEITDD